VLLLLTGQVAPAPASAASAAACVPADAATYRHTFNGAAGTATVTAVRPLCSGQKQTFSLISYTTQSANFAYPQFIYDSRSAAISAQQSSVHLAVTVPACYFQVDLIFGAAIYNEVVNADSNYGNLKLGAPYGTGSRSAGPYGGDADGTTTCVPKPIITYRNACDGTFTATLANDASANVDAVFIVAGQRVRVKPGHAAGAQRHTGMLTIRDNTFTTNIGSWEKPATCSSRSTPVVTSPPVVPPSPLSSSGGAPATPSYGSLPSPADPTYDDGNGDVPINTIAPSTAAASAADTSNTSSVLVIALGVLLMIAGVAILIRVVRTFRHH
jgi:hypothetical protein